MNKLEDILTNVKNERELYFELARSLIGQQKFRKALEVLSEALQADGEVPEDWEIHYLFGIGYKNLNNPGEAFKSMFEAARQTNTFKKECYEYALGLISNTSVKEILPWLQARYPDEKIDSLTGVDKESWQTLMMKCSEVMAINPGLGSLESSFISEDESKELLDEVEALRKQYKFAEALGILDKALSNEPGNYDLLFEKIRILIEGQIDFNRAASLFDDEDFGYRKYVTDERIKEQIALCIDSGTENGNTYFFAAFIGLLMNEPIDQVEEWANEAETLQLKTGKTYPEIGLHILKGELALRRDDLKGATEHYFNAAKYYYYQADYKEALLYFDLIIEKNPGFTEAYIYKADILFLTSFTNDPPYNDENILDKAYQAWHASPGQIVTQSKDAWHYIVIARIQESLYKFRKHDFSQAYWWAILYTERALIHHQEDYSFWMYLGRYLRSMQLEAGALLALTKANELNPKDSALQEERLILLLNTGQFDEAAALLDDLQKPATGGQDTTKPYYQSWAGYIYFHTGRRTDAIPVFDASVTAVPTDIFSRQMKTFCYWYDKNLPEARDEARQILALQQKYTYLKEAFIFSWAHFIAGDTYKAIAEIDDFVKDTGYGGDESFARMQFYLYADRKDEAIHLFDTYISRECNVRYLTELKESLSALAYQFSQDKPESKDQYAALTDTIQNWTTRLNERVLFVSQHPQHPVEEIIAKSKEYHIETGTIAHAACQAILARTYRMYDMLTDARHIFSELTKYPELFPEAQQAMDQLQDATIKQSEKALTEKAYDSIVALLTPFEFEDEKKKKKKQVLLCIAFFGKQDLSESSKYLNTAFDGTAEDAEKRNFIWNELRSHINNTEWVFSFGRFLHSQQDMQIPPSAHSWKNEVIDQWWDHKINTRQTMYPVVTPVVLEMDADMVPPEAYDENWYVINEKVPALRKRLLDAFGVHVPGVRIRANDTDMPKNTYVIMLDEVPLVMRSVYPDRLFVPNPNVELTTLSVTGDTGTDPASGKTGYWVDRKYRKVLDKNSVVYWEDPYDYMLRHLERIMSDHLDTFIQVQSGQAYLEDLNALPDTVSSTQIKSHAADIAQDSDHVLLFVAVLKGLVREKVPVTNKPVIIKTFFENCTEVHEEVSELIQQIRLELKPDLPFNKPGIQKIKLSAEIETSLLKDLVTVEGKTFLAMTPEDCQDALAAIRSLVGQDPLPDTMALVTKIAKLRIHLLKLVELEFPHLMVASENEWITT